jgi:hypothetical protein
MPPNSTTFPGSTTSHPSPHYTPWSSNNGNSNRDASHDHNSTRTTSPGLQADGQADQTDRYVEASLKLIELPKFAGKDRENFLTWKRSVTETLMIKQLPCHAWARMARSALMDQARDFVTGRDPSLQWNFAKLMEELQKEFVYESSAIAAIGFYNTRQYEDEPIPTFFRRLEAAYSYVNPHGREGESSERELVAQALRGVKQDLLAEAPPKTLTYTSIDQLKSELQAVEAFESFQNGHISRRAASASPKHSRSSTPDRSPGRSVGRRNLS